MIPDTANRRPLRLMLRFHSRCQLGGPLRFYSLKVSFGLVVFRHATGAGGSVGGGKNRRLPSCIPCLGKAKQHLAGRSPTVRWDGDGKKSKVRGRRHRDIVPLPILYQLVELASCVGEKKNILYPRKDFRSRHRSLHARIL